MKRPIQSIGQISQHMDTNVVWPMLETLGVVTLAVIGVCGGLWFSRLPKPYWSLGYFAPFCIVLMIGATCEYCAAPDAVFNFPFEVEHIDPPARGGLDDEFCFGLPLL